MKYQVYVFLLATLLFCTGCSSEKKLVQSEIKYTEAMQLYNEQDLHNSKRVLNEILKRDPDFFQAEFLSAKICFFEDNYNDAEKILKKLLKKYPQYTEAKTYLIRTLIFQEKYAEAQELLNAEIKFNTTDWRFYYLYSLIAAHFGQVDVQLNMLENANLCLTDSGKVYLAESLLYKNLNELTRSENSLLRAAIVTDASQLQHDAIIQILKELEK